MFVVHKPPTRSIDVVESGSVVKEPIDTGFVVPSPETVMDVCVVESGISISVPSSAPVVPGAFPDVSKNRICPVLKPAIP